MEYIVTNNSSSFTALPAPQLGNANHNWKGQTRQVIEITNLKGDSNKIRMYLNGPDNSLVFIVTCY